MICNFCGSTIDDNEFECPYCGHQTGVEPQTVSYDENEPEETAYQDNYSDNYEQNSYPEYDEPEEEEEIQRSPKQSRAKSFSSKVKASASTERTIGQLPMLIGIGVSAIISLICLITVISTKSAVEKLEQDMLSQFYQLQSANIELSSQVSALGGDISSVSTTISQANDSKNITITRNPQSDATYLGRGSDEDVSQNSPLFYAEATGAITEIKWEVKEGDEWVAINFDQSSNNLTYGVHLYNEIGKTSAKSTLGSHNVTEQGLNKQYRAVFYDSFGSKATEAATLSERAA